MSIAPPRNRDRGIPGHPTQFAPHDRSLPETAPLTLGDPDLYAINDSFPEPQANNLVKVAAVIEAVAAGADTPTGVAEALAIDDREGAYYGDAAGYLGLVTIASDDVKRYELSPLGEALVDAPTEQVTATVNALVAAAPGVQIYRDHDGNEDLVAEHLTERGLSGETVHRRTQTIVAWANACSQPEGDLAAQVGEEIAGTLTRAAAAAVKVAAERRERIAKNAERVTEVCTGCWIHLPESGICGNCD